MLDRALTTAAAAAGALALVALPQAGVAHADTTVPTPVATATPAVVAAQSPVTVSTADPGSITVSGSNGLSDTRHTTATKTIQLPLATTTGPLGVTVPVIPKPTVSSTHQVQLDRNRNVQVKLPTTTVSIAPVKIGVNVPSIAKVVVPSLPKATVKATANVNVNTTPHVTRTVSIAPVKPVTVAPAAAVVARPATVTTTTSTGTLADTGSPVKPWVVGTGAVLVVLGLDLVAAGRRRRYF